MNTTIRALKVNVVKWIIFRDDADLSDYPEDAIKTFEFESEPATTGTLITAGDLIFDYPLRRDQNNQPSQSAYRMAYDVSFLRAHCTKITFPDGEKTVTEERTSNKPFIDKVVAEKVPVDVLRLFVSKNDPTQITADDVDAAKKLQREPQADALPTDTPA